MRFRRSAEVAGVAAVLALIGIAAAGFCFTRGYSLYDGDAEAHLNIARRVLDSRTPGPERLGTVWLPLPHLLLLPFVAHDDWWRSGLAGVIPSSICFVVAGTFLFAATRRAYSCALAGYTAALLFGLNPNLLYLESTPMTETLFLAALAALLWATLWFRDAQSVPAVLAAAAASVAASLTRYEGWFLIPFVSLYLLIAARRKWHAVLFGALASLGPLAWLAHNQYYFSNALEFYNGPWSAMAIYRRQLASGMTPYPGDHDWLKAVRYYFEASRLAVGVPLLLAGLAGAMVAIVRRRLVWPVVFLLLGPLFYVWSLHSSGTPIFVPSLWPFSFYNTRYAIGVLPLAAFCAGALVAVSRKGVRVAILVIGIGGCGVFLWGSFPPVCWREARANSEARRAWVRYASEFLGQNYRSGSGVLYSFGDLTGVLREAGIPLRESYEDEGIEWDAAVARRDPFRYKKWALAFSGDEVSALVLKASTEGVHYRLRQRYTVPGARVVEIYQREP